MQQDVKNVKGSDGSGMQDVVIIRAGISGIGMACQLKRHFSDSDCPKFTILEARDCIGGTWDLFQYPGVRSDSDMTTYSYGFRPWASDTTLATGEQIMAYLRDTVAEYDLLPHIKFRQKVIRLRWDSAQKFWQIDTQTTQNSPNPAISNTTLNARFIIVATGYYDYAQGYQPDFAGKADFAGDIIHPQDWQADYDYRGKNVVIIGSGATAVTLVPAMVDKARHVTMLQRSPTYIAKIPHEDKLYQWLKRTLPETVAQTLNRGKNIAVQQGVFKVAKKFPTAFRKLLLLDTRRMLKGVDDQHASMSDFSPTYQPWDERLCADPDGDLFTSLKSGKASVVTDHIERFDRTGIVLESGKHLNADLIITATGLKLQMLGGCELFIDDTPVHVNDLLTYKGVLVAGVPNVGVLFGYTNASWTLKVEMASEYLCKLLQFMQSQHYNVVTPKQNDDEITEHTVMGNMRAGYIQRAKNVLPRQGKHAPWRVTNDYFSDYKMYKYHPIDDDNLTFK